MRAHSPSNAHQHHNSPTRHRPNTSSDERKADDKKEIHSEQSKAEAAVKKNSDINSTNPLSQAEKNVVNIEITKTSSKGELSDKRLKGDTTEKTQSPDRKEHSSPKVNVSEKKTQSNVQDGDKKKGDDSRVFVTLLDIQF